MDIYFATTNQGKVQSLQHDLLPFDVGVIQSPIDLAEPRSSDVREIAQAKIERAYPLIQKPTVVVDVGFYIPSLNGFPRAFVNFTLDTIGLEGILKLAEGKDRSCEFKECLAYMDEQMDVPEYLFAHVPGTLSYERAGKTEKHHWSSLAEIFVPKGSRQTLAELSFPEYRMWRERWRSQHSLGNQLGEWLREHK